MTNPFKPHASGLFADRESVADALAYADQLIGTLDGANKAAAWTALMVLVNTAAKLWPEEPAQSVPVILDATALAAIHNRIAAVEGALYSTARVGWTPDELAQLVDSQISGWADANFNSRADSWAEENLSGSLDNQIEEWIDDHLDDRIERWTENNLDIEEEVRETLKSVTISLHC